MDQVTMSYISYRYVQDNMNVCILAVAQSLLQKYLLAQSSFYFYVVFGQQLIYIYFIRVWPFVKLCLESKINFFIFYSVLSILQVCSILLAYFYCKFQCHSEFPHDDCSIVFFLLGMYDFFLRSFIKVCLDYQ